MQFLLIFFWLWCLCLLLLQISLHCPSKWTMKCNPGVYHLILLQKALNTNSTRMKSCASESNYLSSKLWKVPVILHKLGDTYMIHMQVLTSGICIDKWKLKKIYRNDQKIYWHSFLNVCMSSMFSVSFVTHSAFLTCLIRASLMSLLWTNRASGVCDLFLVSLILISNQIVFISFVH